MKIRIGRLPASTLVCLFLFFGLARKPNAQGPTFNPLDGSPESGWTAGNAHSAKVARGFSESVLYKFCFVSQCADGYNPLGGLVQDGAGNLYGTTFAGGSSFGTDGNGGGTVFKVDSTGHETVLYNFCSKTNCADGQLSYAGPILDAAGNLYGTTSQGGANNWGTVFEVNQNSQETVLYSFCSAANCADGQLPYAGLIRDAAGNLYGTTTYGGANNGGTVFKLDKNGHETVLYSFCSATNCTDGQLPYAGLFRDAAGNLYGTTYGGGAIGAANFQGGTVFKLDTAGHETVLYSFCSATNCTDGKQPYAGLVMDGAGNLYGTTSGGGAHGFLNTVGGTVFKLDTAGHETVLYSFCAAGGTQCTDGEMPVGGLVLDAAGNLYGTAAFGGANAVSPNGSGAVFKVNSAGKETVVYYFCSAENCSDGFFPYAGLIQDAAGNLYGTTASGGIFDPNCAGAFSCGTVFKLSADGDSTATVAFTSSPNPSYVNQSVTFSVAVSGSGATPTGSVVFREGTNVLRSLTLTNGTASFAMAFAKAGNASLVASYSGDPIYKPANSNVLKQVVQQYTTSTVLGSSLNPSTYGQSVTLTANVSSSGPTPTGNVTFKKGSAWLGSAPLNGGVATITLSSLSAGSSTITASYGGDTTSAKSTSPPLTQVVEKATSTTAIVSSKNPSMVGKAVTFTATVTSPTTKPTGSVTFMDGSTVLGTGTLGGLGKAHFSTSTLSVGSHNITAVYVGNANVSGSTSPTLIQIVK